MFILLSFIGKLPKYIIECVYQIRLYCNNDIYVITNDLESEYINILLNYNVIIVRYEDVLNQECIDLFQRNRYKFTYHEGLIGREELFMRSQERFFLAYNLLNKYNLIDCFFMEIDNLIYDDPNKWLNLFKRKPFCIMNQASTHYSSAICYIRDKNALNEYIKFAKYYIETSPKDFGGNFSEMICLCHYKQLNLQDIQILPIIFGNDIQQNLIQETYENYDDYKSIFDSASYGIYLLGKDTVHNNGKIIKGETFDWFFIQPQQYQLKWDYDNGYKKPYIFDTIKQEWVLINNLHVHAKNLEEGLSLPIKQI